VDEALFIGIFYVGFRLKFWAFLPYLYEMLFFHGIARGRHMTDDTEQMVYVPCAWGSRGTCGVRRLSLK